MYYEKLSDKLSNDKLRGDTYMTSTFRVVRQKWDAIGRSGVVGNECPGLLILFLLLRKTGFAPWLDIMLSQTLIYYWEKISLLARRQTVKPSFNDTIALFVG